MQRIVIVAGLVFATLGAVSCSSTKSGKIKEDVPPPWVSQFGVAPLGVENINVTASDGYHVVFIKLSRFADSMSFVTDENPPGIRLYLSGPNVGEDIPPDRIITPDRMVPGVTVSRTNGNVTLVLEISATEVPPYIVNEMADYIQVRISPPL